MKKLLLTLFAACIMFPAGYISCMPGDLEEQMEDRQKEQQLDTGGQAYAEYQRAHNYELQYPYEVPEVIQMYKAVIQKYPGTNAARLSQEGVDRCSKKRY